MAETVKDIIDRIRAIHGQLCTFYEGLSDTSARERVRMLLKYVSRHERAMEEALTHYEQTASQSVLNTWFKNTPDNTLHQCLAGAAITPDMSADEVMKIVLDLDHCLVETFRRIAESAVADDVRDLFQRLIAMEERQEHRLVRDAVELEDV